MGSSEMNTYGASNSHIRLAVVLLLALTIFSLNGGKVLLSAAKGLSESERYVHDFVNTPPYGNWTFVKKPIFPVHFNQSQIPIGSNWTVVCPLTANHAYHIYFYGKWTDFESNPSTDYDIYVYNPFGELEGYHTESAGLPEHLGTTVDDPLFIPEHSGNYSFVLRNDPQESKGSKPATLMIIENEECNLWQEVFIEGKESNAPVFNTSWAFEVVTESQHIEVWVKVPKTLDMYEARLYLMANPSAGKGETLNDFPLAWEEGLYGNISGIYGGYNLESMEYRGLAYASCEFYGQDMLINYTSPGKGKSLYHLVLIGEKGAGRIDFLVKTEFGKAHLTPINPPLRVRPDNETSLTFVSNCTDLRSAALNFSVSNWKNFTALNMELINVRTCHGVIPGQPAGTTVKYNVKAMDVLENVLVYNGNYTVKHASQLNVTLKTETIAIGENITLTGLITPPCGNLSITLTYTSVNGTFQQTVYTSANGTFAASFKPTTQGTWTVQSAFKGNNILYSSASQSKKFKVTSPSFLSQYSIYIYAGAGAGAGLTTVALVYIKKRRE